MQDLNLAMEDAVSFMFCPCACRRSGMRKKQRGKIITLAVIDKPFFAGF